MTAAVTQDVATSVTADPDTPDDTWFIALRRSFYVIRIPIAMAIIVAVVLILPEQVQEIYRALAQDRPDRQGFQFHWPSRSLRWWRCRWCFGRWRAASAISTPGTTGRPDIRLHDGCWPGCRACWSLFRC